MSVKFHVFLLDEIYVGGPKLVYGHIMVGYVREKIPKDHPRVVQEGPMLVAKTAQGSPIYGWKTTVSGLVGSRCILILGR